MATVTMIVNYAPCGDCGEVIPRDDMHSMNVKFYDPEDSRQVRVPIRLCRECRDHWLEEVRPMRWSNSKMVEREVQMDSGLDKVAVSRR